MINEISINIKSANTILDDMIEKALEQEAKNIEMLFTLKHGLKELSKYLRNSNVFSKDFLNNWDAIMGWAPRVFEEHPLLDILKKIDDFVMSHKS